MSNFSSSQRLLTPLPLPQETDEVDSCLRPQLLSEFLGQAEVCQNLKIFIDAARSRKEALDHVLLSGPPGLGKTTLAGIVAKEMGVNFRATSGPIITRAGDLAAILTNLQEGDVLFIDEIHRLNPAVEEVLYPALEDFVLDILIGEGPAARTVRLNLPPFTLIGATTRAGLVSRPLRERFGIPLRMNFYTSQELQEIVQRQSRLFKMNIEDAGAHEIARRSRGTPRIAGRLLRRVRDIATVLEQRTISQSFADQALTQLQVSRQGLDAQDIRYLKLMADFYQGGPVGVETLAAALGEQRDVLEDVIEPYLLQEGFLHRTPRGRQLTELGWVQTRDIEAG